MLSHVPEGVVWAIMLLPLGSAAAIALASLSGLTQSRGWSPRFAGYVTIATIAAAFVLSLWVLDSAIDADGVRIGFDAHEWVVVGPLHVDIGVTVDGLTAIMLVVVTAVSLLVQFYSQEYMRGDEGYSRYYAFMSLFTGSMLGLVLASNILQLFVFWEMVGLCSYLLIGFWFYKDSARRAATKAFVVTRVGDLGFLTAILLIWTETGELSIPQIQEMAVAGAIGASVVTWFSLGIFAGAAGKSAQFPLHVWLPDAMEGPTPGSARIHAPATGAGGVGGGEGGDRGHGYQAGAGLLHDQPARLHDDGPRRWEHRSGDLPPAHARLLQGAAVPGRGLREPRNGHLRYAEDGRAGALHAGDVRDDGDSRDGAGGRVPAGRLLEQGRDPAGGLVREAVHLLDGADRRVPDGGLRGADAVPDVRGRV